MNWQEWIGIALAIAIMLVGLVGSVVPGLPGTPLVLAAAILYRLYFGALGPSNWVLIALALMTVVSLLLDYLASLLGAKKLGATWRGLVGAMVGALVGLFFAPIGLFLGPFVGALGFELIGGRDFDEAVRAGAGAVLGLILGALGKLACGVAMISLFAVNVLSRG